MKQNSTVIMNGTVTDSTLLRAKRQVAAVNGYAKAKKIKTDRRGERSMIEEDLELSQAVMTDAEIDQWNAAQELSLDRQVGIFGTPVLV